jgi:signal transduction histidine kinase/ABC-type uncharacterized transport system substrate-binding protein
MALLSASVSFLVALGGSPSAGALNQPERPRPREVIVLHSDRQPDVVDAILSARLQAAPGGAHLVTENLDLARLDDEDYTKWLVGLLRRKYQDRHVDLVVPVLMPAIRFMAEKRDVAFPGVPVVFCAVDAERLRYVRLPPFIAGIGGRVAPLPTVQAALGLQPETRRVVLVAGESPGDRYWRERFREELRSLEPRVEVIVLQGLTMPELLDRLRTLPDQTIVFFVTLTEDAAGSLYSTDALRLVGEASGVPVYAAYEEALGLGVVGGYMFSYEREAEKAADVALRVLRGARPEDIGVHEAQANAFVFDWRQLRRWNLPESRLPAGSVVRFRPPSAWDLYRLQILAGLAVLLLQAGLLVGLLLQASRRRRAEQELDERLRFETLLSDLTRSVTQSEVAALDGEIDNGLRRLAETLRVDRAELGEFVEGSGDFKPTHTWVAPGIERLPPVMDALRFPWIAGRLRAGQAVRFSRLAELPEEAALDRKGLDAVGTHAAVMIPLSVGGAALGALGLGMLRRERSWPDELVKRLRLSAEIFASTLMRRRFERLLEESRGFGTSLFASLHGQVAVLDRRGTIVAVNAAWAQAARAEGVGGATTLVGASYLEARRAALERAEPDAGEVLRGLVAVLENAEPGFSIEYRTAGPGGERWFELLAEPLRRAEGGAVITLVDITDRKRAELEAGRLRDDLAHLTRVSTLGELAASLAHELNQPLTAILSNVQAAQILLDRDSPDLAEVREILSEVVTDDERAGEIIRHLRSLFKKGQRERAPLDVNELIREVLRLLQNDVALRGASFRVDLGAGLPLVEGDRVQLQQVVLNLVVNGLDAMRDRPPGERHLTIRSSLDKTKMQIEVADLGQGIPEADRERLFEPFYTTKPAGMGMGLAIARSIVEAHGGSLSVVNRPGVGATFRVLIPTTVAH